MAKGRSGRVHFNTYLQPKNLLPFFYQCLNDKSAAVRECAVLCIKNFGAHGELMFIEGISKEASPQIRAECAFGLGSIGAQTFRTLLLALHDGSMLVKDAASRAILDNMSAEDIEEQFQDRAHQKQTICCTIKELLSNNNQRSHSFLRNNILSLLQQILHIFDP